MFELFVAMLKLCIGTNFSENKSVPLSPQLREEVRKLDQYIDDMQLLCKYHIGTADSDSDAVLDQLYQTYAESHESDPPEIRDSFKELDELLGVLPLDDNNAVFNLCCSLCTAYERKAFQDGVQYGAHLMKELL